MSIVALCGLAGSGKGTCGDILQEYHFVKMSFADSLKDAVSSIFGWNRDLLEGDTVESRNFREIVDPFWSNKFGRDITPRIILQEIGTDLFRDKFLDSIWIDSLERKLSKYDDVVICDVRFPNEIEFLASVGAKIIEVSRPEIEPEWVEIIKYNTKNSSKYFDRGVFMSLHHPEVHPSEFLWVGNKFINNVIINDGSKKDLIEKLLKTIY